MRVLPWITARVVILAAFFAPLLPGAAAPAVWTANYDNARTGANLAETILNPGSVTPATFGKLFAMGVDGQVYAQPLYLPGIAVTGQGTHNVVFVATMHNSVYAFDADAPGVPLWHLNFGSSVPSVNFHFTDILPEIGILSTPVIDAAAGVLYCVSDHYENGDVVFRLHAIDLHAGRELPSSPVAIAGSVAGSGDAGDGSRVSFYAVNHLQRPGLLLLHGVVYLAFGSHADANPYHGWIFGYDGASLRQVAVFNTTPNGARGSVWQSGRGLAADDAGFLYVASANGDFDGKTNFGDCILKLGTQGGLSLADWFSPADNSTLDADDNDLGSGGVILIPGTAGLVAGGKDGTGYLLSSANLGHQQTGNSGATQAWAAASNGIYGMALWPRGDQSTLYVQHENAVAEAYRMTAGQFGTLPGRTDLTTGTAYEGFALSANGAQLGTGVLWVTEADADGQGVGGLLAAFDATTLAPLWNSRQYAEDGLGNFAKFATPTVVNGKVYVPTFSNSVAVYGPMSRQNVTPAGIDLVVNAASYSAGAVSAGEVITLFGRNLAADTVSGPAFTIDGSVGTELGNVELTFDGVPAPMLYALEGQVAAVVPFSVQGQSQTEMRLLTQGSASAGLSLAVSSAAPGLFTADQSGFGQGAILNQNNSVNSAGVPAARGSIVQIYGTGGSPAGRDGRISYNLQFITKPVKVSIGGVAADVLYAGSAPGLVDGVFQINARVPASIDAGEAVPLSLSIDGVNAQTGVTLAIQ